LVSRWTTHTGRGFAASSRHQTNAHQYLRFILMVWAYKVY